MRNKPKGSGRKPTVETPDLPTRRPDSPDDGPSDVDFGLPGRIRPQGSDVPSGVILDSPTAGASHNQASVTVTVTPIIDLVSTQHNASQSPLQAYVQNPPSALSAHNDVGLRSYKGRPFADMASDDATAATQTVMVGYHEAMKAYRAKLPNERAPTGPPLYRIADSNTWSLQKPIEYYDSTRYASSHTPDTRGYYAVREQAAITGSPFKLKPVDIGFALKDERGRLIRVDPLEARGDASVPLKLAHWTDGDIWSAYRLRESEALVFRSEAEAKGRAPDWATRFDEPDMHKYLTDSLRWSYPQKSLAERAEILRAYNLSIAQRNQLRRDMEHGVFPEWAEQHKRLTQSDDARRFQQIAEELDPYILSLRTEGENPDVSLPDVKQRYDSQFLNSYLEHAGYKRNVHDMLYRTDIPAMFRADLRTPFELARDKRLVKLRGNPSDSTTKRALSATFSLSDGVGYTGLRYYSNPRHYNSQANRYPGHFSDSDSSSGRRHSTDGESDTSFEMDNSRDYPLRRRQQTLGFLYVIDTRGVEVVPRAENIYLNDKDFDGDVLEGRISMPTRGISAERIWLVHSDLTKAARVEDVFRQAGDNAEAIEQATWAGNDEVVGTFLEMFPSNEFEVRKLFRYDQLIDELAKTEGVVLNLSQGRGTYSDDVVWPVPEHYRP
ncbi:hypothetical protein [Pseudomonas sp. A34-9]|uniref:hypothetical protein n=1 Tax=Pseudomonas sp. A34-9 TaxID=3034675 RepID=UPI00240D0962|nr:hypothetical protein [Pseudomonas sp. A34-9]